MIYLITGVPGSGKSLRTIHMILEWRKEGRQVYADIDGLQIDGVLPSPADWRDTPEGSVVIYDECQKIFPSDGKAGVATDERMRAMETHRHTGHDLVFITQAPTFVHHHIRKLVGKHIHCYRAMGLQGCTLFKWDGVCDNPNGFHERKEADSERWTYPKELFQYYKSATVHTHKFKMPKKLIMLLGFASIVIGLAVTYGLNSGIAQTIKNSSSDKSIAGSTAQSAPEPVKTAFINQNLADLVSAQTMTVSISGCVSGRFCRCFDIDGNIIDLAETQCRDYSEGNLALPIKIPMDSGSKDTN